MRRRKKSDNKTMFILVSVIALVIVIVSFLIGDWILSRQKGREERIRYIDGFSSEVEKLDTELFGGDGINIEQ